MFKGERGGKSGRLKGMSISSNFLRCYATVVMGQTLYKNNSSKRLKDLTCKSDRR